MNGEGEYQEVPNVYVDRSPGNIIYEGEPRALYWENYRKKYLELKDVLKSGEQVPTSESICIIANNCLNPHNFDLRKKDRQPIGEVVKPGISAHINFSDNPHEVCGAVMDRDLKRQDCIYVASVLDVVDAGWIPILAPTPNQPLHVRLVPIYLVGNDPEQPAMILRNKLVEVFNKNKIRRSAHSG